MHYATLHHIEMAGELSALQAALSSTTESMLWCSPNDTFHMEVLGKQVTEFEKLEEWRSWLERPAARIYDLLLGPAPDRAHLADHLDEATG
jgi:hypothetical protein